MMHLVILIVVIAGATAQYPPPDFLGPASGPGLHGPGIPFFPSGPGPAFNTFGFESQPSPAGNFRSQGNGLEFNNYPPPQPPISAPDFGSFGDSFSPSPSFGNYPQPQFGFNTAQAPLSAPEAQSPTGTSPFSSFANSFANSFSQSSPFGNYPQQQQFAFNSAQAPVNAPSTTYGLPNAK